MDPLSMTASTIAILGLTTQLAGYITAVRGASKQQKTLAIEANNLSCVLTNLRFRVELSTDTHPWFQQ